VVRTCSGDEEQDKCGSTKAIVQFGGCGSNDKAALAGDDEGIDFGPDSNFISPAPGIRLV